MIDQSLHFQPGLDTRLDEIAVGLENQGHVIIEQFFPDDLLHGLLAHFKAMDNDQFSQAGVGRESEYRISSYVRKDEIHWLDGTQPLTAEYFHRMEQLRTGLNRRLFLGLFDYECHYAWYPQGAFYKTHVDAFAGTDTRVISTVLYLNPAWQPGDGGELVIYRPDQGAIVDMVAPVFGRLVLFLSKEFPHEVLPVNKPRYSLTGWFRKNNSLCSSIDPAR